MREQGCPLVEIVVIIMCKRRSRARASLEQLNWNGEREKIADFLLASLARANPSCLSSYNNYYIHREVDQARIEQYYYFFSPSYLDAYI